MAYNLDNWFPFAIHHQQWWNVVVVVVVGVPESVWTI